MPATASPLPMMRARPREIVLLPDQRFWVRSIPLVTGDEAPTVREQVELALEASAPFPLGQLYYGYWSRTGADRALVFAAYRKRFSEDETERWRTAELVAPMFACWLGVGDPAPGSTHVLRSATGVTVVHYAEPGGVPTSARSADWPEDATSSQQSKITDELIRRGGGTRHVEAWDTLTADAGKPGDEALSFRSGDQTNELSLRQAEMIDVRDGQELGARRRGRQWDRWLWRTLVAAVVVVAASLVSEGVLWGVGRWQQAQEQLISERTPVVSEIMTANNLAVRIEELRTQRLRPFEMIELADAPRPDSILFETARTTGLYTLEVRARTNAQDAIDPYRRKLAELPGVISVEIPPEDLRYGNGQTTFRMVVTFAPDALSAGVQS